MADPFGAIGSQLVGGLTSAAVWIVLGLFLCGLIGWAMWYFVFYRKSFDIDVIIRSERSGEGYKVIRDKAAIKKVKSGKKRVEVLRLWKTKKDLPVPPFKILEQARHGDFLEIYRRGEHEFRYLLPPVISKKILTENEHGEFIALSETEQQQIDMQLLDWILNRLERDEKLFSTEGVLSKILPLLPQIVGGMIMIFLLYIVFDKLPGLITQLTELARELRTLKGAEIITSGLTWIMSFQRV